MRRFLLTCIAFATLGSAGAAEAHKLSDSYLSLRLPVAGATIVGQWDIALRDLDYAIGIDANHDGAITWGELKGAELHVAQYALRRLTIEAIGRGERDGCVLVVGQLLVDEHVDGHYAVLRLTAACPFRPAQLAVHYALLFDVDPTHRGLVQIEAGGVSQAAVLPRAAPTVAFNLASPQRWQQFVEFVGEGVWHIWKGYDHILFLLTLLIPAVIVFRNGRWQACDSWQSAAGDVVKVVTAFTVAHSLTLSLAVLGFVHVPSRLVESTIAATVLLGALNNLVPLVRERRWMVAFAFGLVHGLGFASVLADLGLQGLNLSLALIGFNAGVEAGQLAIVAVFLPLALLLRDTLFYRRVFVPIGSGAISLIAAMWFYTRLLGNGG
jgi:HupE / UreJ protein